MRCHAPQVLLLPSFECSSGIHPQPKLRGRNTIETTGHRLSALHMGGRDSASFACKHLFKLFSHAHSWRSARWRASAIRIALPSVPGSVPVLESLMQYAIAKETANNDSDESPPPATPKRRPISGSACKDGERRKGSSRFPSRVAAHCTGIAQTITTRVFQAAERARPVVEACTAAVA